MRTVEQMKQDYERSYSYKYMTQRKDWINLTNAAQDLEDSRYIIVSLVNSKIRVSFPDWYKLKPTKSNRNDIMRDIFTTLYDYDIVSLKFGKQAIWIEVVE